jgi:ABC-type multidrug transport system permease subunit
MYSSDKIILGFFVFVIMLFCVMIYFVCQSYAYQQAEIEKCFMQEPITKECELVLYKYENRTKHTTTVIPMPVVVR